MFTGIVRGLCEVTDVQRQPKFMKYRVKLTKSLLKGLENGASVSVDGACQTVVSIDKNEVTFDAIDETLIRTTLDKLHVGRLVNIERSARFGDEIGGHFLSGHIFGKALIKKIHLYENNCEMIFQCDPTWTKYLFSKGYVAIDGASLTLVQVDPRGQFTVHLIPETLKLTTLGRKKEGDSVNIELDSQTQAIVDTVERVLSSRGISG